MSSVSFVSCLRSFMIAGMSLCQQHTCVTFITRYNYSYELHYKNAVLLQGNCAMSAVICPPHTSILPGISGWSAWSRSILLCYPVGKNPMLIFMQLFSKLQSYMTNVADGRTDRWLTQPCSAVHHMVKHSIIHLYIITKTYITGHLVESVICVIFRCGHF